MASFLCSLFFLTTLAFAAKLRAAQLRQSNISLDASLYPTTTPTSWLSPSGCFAIGFYPEGSGFAIGVWFVTYPGNNTVIWTADRDEGPIPKDAVLRLSADGLKLLNKGSEDRTVSQFSYSDSQAASASLLDTGNFVIYDSDSNILWQTFDYPTDTIMGGQALSAYNEQADNELISSVSETNHSSGRFRLKMQNDGNLVSYPVDTEDNADNAYWSSGTYGKDYTSLNLDGSGFMYLLGDNGTMNLTANSSRRAMLIYRARLDSDGIFRLYVHDLGGNTTQVVRSITDLQDKCMIKGACGFNSYCTYMDGQVVCICLPGFNYTDPHNTLTGCTQNFTNDGCTVNNDNVTYSMSRLDGIVWFDSPYTVLSQFTNADDCKNACLDDCNCDAVQFADDQCMKQRLPLRYGRQDSHDSPSAFIKIGTGGSVEGRAALPTAVPMTRIRKELNGKILIVCIAATAALATALTGISLFIYKSRVGRHQPIRRSKDPGLTDDIALRSFSYHELREATDGFKEKLGKGAFGTVFKGTLSNGERIIAVKRLEKMVDEGDKEFRTEMKAIGRTHHRNLVRLLGFCDEGSNRLLVYEYMSNGSLADLIFGAERRRSWNERVRIAMDVAQGLHYLHEECENRIIHCDIKPQNILMDENWTAKISDFGLAKMLMPNQTRTFTGIRGTRGYLAPEWHKNAPISVKADIYSFGIVLLEIICGRKNMELEAEVDEIVLSEWVYNCFLAGELKNLLIKNETVDMEELEKLVKVGLWCIQSEPASRPSMKNVVMMLEGHTDVSPPPPPSPMP